MLRPCRGTRHLGMDGLELKAPKFNNFDETIEAALLRLVFARLSLTLLGPLEALLGTFESGLRVVPRLLCSVRRALRLPLDALFPVRVVAW